MKREEYRNKLRKLQSWDRYLLRESGLPGPRGNIELAQAVADEGNVMLFLRFLSIGPGEAPVNSPKEFLPFCGVIGLGRLAAEGKFELLRSIRVHASDSRWRMREGVAMALQRVGDRDMPRLIEEMEAWSRGNLLEKRAAAAALCEPRLLVEPKHAQKVLHILDTITASLIANPDRRGDEFVALRKGLGYCWSVAAAALPDAGKALMEKWFNCPDDDVRWIMRENLKKNRLARVDAAWIAHWQAKLDRKGDNDSD